MTTGRINQITILVYQNLRRHSSNFESKKVQCNNKNFSKERSNYHLQPTRFA